MREIVGKFIIGIYDFDFSPELKSFLKDFPVAGFAIFNSPWDKPDNVWSDPKAALEKVFTFFQEISGRAPFLAVDQEGGRVRRFRGHYIDLPSANEISEYFSKTKNIRDVESLYSLAAKQLHLSGVSLDFSPVVDLSYPDASLVVGDRSYGKNLPEIKPLVKAFCESFKSAGVGTTLKHYPGHGPTKFDSHEQTAILFKDRGLYEKEDQAAFLELSPYADAIMTGHLAFEDEPDRILSLDSKFLTQARNQFEPSKFWITDDLLQMKAVSEQQPWLKAIDAGYDYILLCGKLEKAAVALEESIRFIEGKNLDFENREALKQEILKSRNGFKRRNTLKSGFEDWRKEILKLEKEAEPILERIHDQRETS